MLTDKIKQQARMNILNRLREKGMPQTEATPSPVPEPMSGDQVGADAPEETMNDIGITDDLRKRLNKKKRPGKPIEDSESDASQPVDVNGAY